MRPAGKLAAFCVAAFCVSTFVLLGGSFGGQVRRYDESRSFDRAYAERFLTDIGPRRLFLLGYFAQFFVPLGARDDPPSASPPVEASRALQDRKVAEGSVKRAKPRFPAADTAGRSVVDDVCGCRFAPDGSIVDATHCKALRNDDDEEMAHMDVLPLIDISTLARPLACFRDGSPACVDEGGLRFGGLSCCQRVDAGLRGASFDGHFYMLAPATLVRRLKGLVPGPVAASSPEMCGFRFDVAQGTFSPPQRFDGTFARAALHAFFRYGTTPLVTPDILVAVSERSPATLYEVVRERILRVRLRAPEKMLDNALRAVPVSRGFRYNGASE